MTETPINIFRNQVAKIILVGIAILTLILVMAFFTPSYESSELTEILRILLPIKALYMTTMITYLINSQGANGNANATEDNRSVSRLYHVTTRFILIGHLVGLNTIILLGMMNLIENNTTVNGIAFLESLVGVYVGVIFTDLFGQSE